MGRWAPQPGPQTDAIRAASIPELLFGGARGGGKSSYLLGDYCADASLGLPWRGIVFRQSYPELEELIFLSHSIIPNCWPGSEWFKQEKTWHLPTGATLRMRSLERPEDAAHFQGHSYCVAIGTPVLMADGSWRSIEAIGVGERVMTMVGPRPVVARMRPYSVHCVRAVVRDAGGHILGEQVHPLTHPVLSSVSATLSPSPEPHRSALQSRLASLGVAVRPQSRLGGDPGSWGWCAYSADGRTGDAGSSWSRQASLQPARWCVPVVLHAPTARSAMSHLDGPLSAPTEYRTHCKPPTPSWPKHPTNSHSSPDQQPLVAGAPQIQDHDDPCCPNESAYALRETHRGRDWPAHCDAGHGRCDAHVPGVPEIGRDGSPVRGGAAVPCQDGQKDVLDTIPRRNHPAPLAWVHPYSGEVRHLSEAVDLGMMEAEPCGERLVADITVSDAAHYITATGLINRNSWIGWDELCNWADDSSYKMLMATLRSAEDVPHKRIRASANPSGPGMQWVKARFIDPAPHGYEVIKDAATGMLRVFIPSRLEDNRILMQRDPTYIDRLRGVGSPELVRAWLEGDWSAVVGAYFPEFGAQHIRRPFDIPVEWLRFRALDWGSARPTCCLWCAVSDGEVLGVPRGALVVYREMYLSSEPNVGLRMTVEEVADRIKYLEMGDEPVRYSVADPAIFAADGGPSIGERFAQKRLYFKAADNRRVGKVGAMAGWDLVRQRLKGEDDQAMLLIFSTCTALIRTLPAMQHDARRPEDLDTTAEDHAVDALRYACASRPWIAAPPTRGPSQLTLDALWEMRERERASYH